MFEFLGRYLLIAMEWVNNNLIHNYAIAIIVFTGVLKLLTLPADLKQRRNTARMQELQPAIAKINKRYGENSEQSQKRIRELQKREKVSMTAGCLPMALTFLVFMIFFRAMTFWSYLGTIDLYRHAREQELQALRAGQELRIDKDGANDFINENYKVFWVNNIWSPDSFMKPVVMSYSQFSQIDASKLSLYYDDDLIERIGSITAADYNRTMQPYMEAYSSVRNGWGILPVLAALSMFSISLIQQKLNPQRNAPSADNPAAAQQAAAMSTPMMLVMAGMSGYICFTSNAGFAIYWMVSNIYSFVITISISLPPYLKQKQKGNSAGQVVLEAAIDHDDLLGAPPPKGKKQQAPPLPANQSKKKQRRGKK